MATVSAKANQQQTPQFASSNTVTEPVTGPRSSVQNTNSQLWLHQTSNIRQRNLEDILVIISVINTHLFAFVFFSFLKKEKNDFFCQNFTQCQNNNQETLLTTGDLGIRVQLEMGVQNCITDLVADLIYKQRREKTKGKLLAPRWTRAAGWAQSEGATRRHQWEWP